MIDFSRFWMAGDERYEDEDFDESESGDDVPPAATAAEIVDWERRHAVRLPEPIRTAIAIQNGGCVRNSSVEILPLAQIQPVDEEFWEYTELNEDEAADRDLLFVFGNEAETGADLLMNFNARGPSGDPSVYVNHHGESTDLVNESLSAFFAAELAGAPEPSVDWRQAVTAGEPVAREVVDLSRFHGGSAVFEQILLRAGQELLLFTNERSGRDETLSRTTLPLPLDPEWAQIRPFRPPPIGTFGLHLQPVESDGIVEKRSHKTADGHWKNTTSHGTPIYVMFESTDRDKLEALRAQVLGSDGAAKAEAKQARDADFQASLAKLSPEQRMAALLNEALDFKNEADRQFASQFADLSTAAIPPELAQAGQAIRQKLEQMTEMARKKIADTPVDPEVLKQIKKRFSDK
jgi:hypothetical protein